MSTYKELYNEAKDLMKRIMKKGFYDIYSSKDFFYMLDENSKGIMVFSQKLYNDGYGIQLFYNQSGLNYLHDLLCTTSQYPANYFYCDCLLLGIIPKKDLTESDIKFLRKNKLRIMQENNFVPFRYKEGYGKSYMSKTELSIVNKYLCYLYAILTNESEDVYKALTNELTPIAIFDNQECTYQIQYTGMPLLEKMPRVKPVIKDLLNDFSNPTFINDTCYFFHGYYPYPVDNTNAFVTVIIAYYVKQNKFKYELINCKPESVDQYFIGFMDTVFNEIGLPTSVLFNHRKLYSLTVKTLEKLGIEVEFKREFPDLDDKMCIELFNIAKASIEVDDGLEAIDESLDEWEVSEESYEYVS